MNTRLDHGAAKGTEKSGANVHSKRVRDPEAKKKAISKAATKLFVTQGYFPTTLEQIAKASSVSKSTILLHFKSKDNLARELTEYHFAALGEHHRTLSKDYGSTEEHIRRGNADYVRWCAKNPYPARFLVALRHQEFVTDPELTRRIADETSRATRKILQRGQEEGSVRAGDLEFLAHTMSAPAQKMVRMKLELGLGGNLEEMADSLGELAWQIVRAE